MSPSPVHSLSKMLFLIVGKLFVSVTIKQWLVIVIYKRNLSQVQSNRAWTPAYIQTPRYYEQFRPLSLGKERSYINFSLNSTCLIPTGHFRWPPQSLELHSDVTYGLFLISLWLLLGEWISSQKWMLIST